MSALLQEVKAQALQITHLNIEEKAKHMNQNDCRWEDILNKAEDLYKEQMVDVLERWPPACNTRDSKAPPSQLTANLSQAPLQYTCKDKDKDKRSKDNKDRNSNGNDKGKQKKDQEKKNKKDSKKKNPKFQPPCPDEKPICFVNGEPLYERTINGRKFQWCWKCSPPRWSTTHNSGTHTGKVNARNNPDAQVNYGLVPDPSIWIAKTFVPLENSDFDKPSDDSFFNHIKESSTHKRKKSKGKHSKR